MSLYLQVVVGDGLYLLDAARIVEIRPADGAADRDAPCVDLRTLLAAPAGTEGYAIQYQQSAGGPVALLVDRVDGLAEIEDRALFPLPPIGPAGMLIDAVLTGGSGDTAPPLRLRGERALAAAAGGN